MVKEVQHKLGELAYGPVVYSRPKLGPKERRSLAEEVWLMGKEEAFSMLSSLLVRRKEVSHFKKTQYIFLTQKITNRLYDKYHHFGSRSPLRCCWRIGFSSSKEDGLCAQEEYALGNSPTIS